MVVVLRLHSLQEGANSNNKRTRQKSRDSRAKKTRENKTWLKKELFDSFDRLLFVSLYSYTIIPVVLFTDGSQAKEE